ncbi:hypothetical protein [Nocardia asteroides]|uniref:hypothetical protein n=1 Tax=Nocardia asteroides TaxID=1824 RepID=UPI001E5D07BB|nr:hypothetical protein [Nocardia asteroides]UGT62224.1 hypothetical protein LTT61_02420 [Nocardia asteroides]
MGTHAREPGTADPTSYFDPGERWVPVDRRWFGMDRRTLLPALVVLALAFLQGVLLPRLDDAIADDDVTAAGDVIALDGGITFPAAPGWALVDGERAGDEPSGRGYPTVAVLASGGTRFSVQTGDFNGDANALLDQIERTDAALSGGRGLTATGDPAPVSTDRGATGVSTRYTTAQLDGVLAAFVFDGIGVEVVAIGPAGADQDIRTEVGAMIAGLGRTGER